MLLILKIDINFIFNTIYAQHQSISLFFGALRKGNYYGHDYTPKKSKK